MHISCEDWSLCPEGDSCLPVWVSRGTSITVVLSKILKRVPLAALEMDSHIFISRYRGGGEPLRLVAGRAT